MNQRQLRLTLYIGSIVLLVGWSIFLYISPQFSVASVKLQRPVLLVWGLLSALGLCFLWVASKIINNTGSFQLAKHDWGLIIVTAILMRILMLFSTPVLENDFERYFLDGNMILSGMNPYEVYPQELLKEVTSGTSERDLSRFTSDTAVKSMKNVNHQHIRTIYPPFAQAVFTVVQWIAPWSMVAWKIFLFILEIIIVFALIEILKSLQRPLTYLILFLWNPIVIKEFYNVAHMDLILLFPIALALMFYLKSRYTLTGAMLGLAIAAKLWPIVLVPFFLKGLERQKIITFVISLGVTFTIMMSPLLFISYDNDSGFVRFGTYWAMNDALYNFIYSSIQHIFALSYDVSFKTARFIVGAALLGCLYWFWRRSTIEKSSVVKNMTFFMCSFFILLPTQFPWYYSWLLLFLVIFPVNALLVYSCVIFTYYLRFHFLYRQQVDVFDGLFEVVPAGSLHRI